jgi:hypothetical protein
MNGTRWQSFLQAKTSTGSHLMNKLTGLDEMFLSVDATGTTNGVTGGMATKLAVLVGAATTVTSRRG